MESDFFKCRKSGKLETAVGEEAQIWNVEVRGTSKMGTVCNQRHILQNWEDIQKIKYFCVSNNLLLGSVKMGGKGDAIRSGSAEQYVTAYFGDEVCTAANRQGVG